MDRVVTTHTHTFKKILTDMEPYRSFFVTLNNYLATIHVDCYFIVVVGSRVGTMYVGSLRPPTYKLMFG